MRKFINTDYIHVSNLTKPVWHKIKYVIQFFCFKIKNQVVSFPLDVSYVNISLPGIFENEMPYRTSFDF